MARRAQDREQQGPQQQGPQQQAPAARNEVVLVGRVAAAPQERELPSGDLLVSLRLVVDRPAPTRSARGRGPTVDALDCACFTAGSRRAARGLVAGDVVEVAGSLRRRFWRAGGGAASRCEVEVTGLRRLQRSTAPAGARPRRPAGRRAGAEARREAGGLSDAAPLSDAGQLSSAGPLP